MQQIINIGIIAHVDHGKTTLVDHLLRQSGTFRANEQVVECVMDSNELERERGITIFAKNAAIFYKGTKINIVDTPGHADFGSEVERVLKMVDSVLLLVDAAEGPMPQTKFVLKKSLELGLRPIVVINKIDRKDARAHGVVDLVFELFIELGANDGQLDFPILYTIARQGIAKRTLEEEGKDLGPLFETMMSHVPPYPDKTDQPLQIQITNLDYDDYIGRIGIGRIYQGKVKKQDPVIVCKRNGEVQLAKITKLFVFEGLKRKEVEEASCGDIVAIAGLAGITIGETICLPENPLPMSPLKIGEPTLTMNFLVNDSPFAGKEGRFVTNRQIKERLEREAETNVGLRVEPLGGVDGYKVSGRGELHLSILLETMRREGYEVQVSRPEVILKEVDGVTMEPTEQLMVTIPDPYAGTVIEKLGIRKGEMQGMRSEHGVTVLEYLIPTRGLIGYHTEFVMDTKGEGLLDHTFSHYEPFKGKMAKRPNGVLISGETGTTVAYAFWNLQERGVLFLEPGVPVYEGMIIGQNSREQDMTVNPCKEKRLTNMRSSTADEAIRLIPPRILTLEQALEFIEQDELVELTPKSIRLRKKFLSEQDRRRNRFV
jgi:GTP-binding protein